MLAQENLCVQHSCQVCIWVKKNLTVSTDPNFLKDQFNLEYERANKVADLAKSKQNTSKVVFLPSAINFFVQPTEDEHRQVFF